MTRNDFLNAFKAFTDEAIADLMLPVRVQAESESESLRPAKVYRMRLPDGTSAQKKAPYIIHQIITGKDSQSEGELAESRISVRSIFCVYCDDSEEGSLMLLELMERLRIALLRQIVIDNRFQLDLDAGLETLIYPDDTAPYYLGEMMSNWRMPAVKREDRLWL